MLLFVLFLFINASFLQARCPDEIRFSKDVIYLYWEGEIDANGSTSSPTITLPDGTSVTLNPANVPTWSNAIPYAIPPELADQDLTGEVEISIGEDGPCFYEDGVLVSCELSQACLNEVENIAEDIAEDVAGQVVAANQCKFWEGDCGTISSIKRTGRVAIGRDPLWSDSRLTLKGNLDLVATGATGWRNQIRFHAEGGGLRHIITDHHDTGRLLFRAGLNDSSGGASEIEFHASVGIGRGGNINMPLTIGADNLDISHYRLYVEGGILTEEVRVRNDWADYVFQEDYALKSLTEVEQFIDQNGHLHNVPSAAQVEDEGFEIGDMTKVQQEKIEEIFLHIIEMDKRIKALEAENAALKRGSGK